jgi:hypothetical protein
MPGVAYLVRRRSTGERAKSFPGSTLCVEKIETGFDYSINEMTMKGLRGSTVPDLQWIYIGNICNLQTLANEATLLLMLQTTGFYTSNLWID